MSCSQISPRKPILRGIVELSLGDHDYMVRSPACTRKDMHHKRYLHYYVLSHLFLPDQPIFLKATTQQVTLQFFPMDLALSGHSEGTAWGKHLLI